VSGGKLIRAVRTPSGAVGAAIVALVVAVAFLGPFVASGSPTAPVGAAGSLPFAGHLLGTDYLGRDVLTRVLHGGSSVLLMGLASTASAYAVALTVGMVAGYIGRFTDTLLMRGVDVILAFPPLVILLLLVGGFQVHIWVLILGVVIVQIPGIARISRTATLAVVHTKYVEASRARGDSTAVICARDILPNILQTVLADFGIRFGLSIILIASMNYLGLGLAPPSSDWGLMVSENKPYLSLNPWAVIAPAIMLALLTIGVNLVADAYIRTAFSSDDGAEFQPLTLPGGSELGNDQRALA